MQAPNEEQAPQLGNLSGMVAPELKYGESTALGLPSVKTLREFHAENQSTFTPSNNIIRIPVSSMEFLDLMDCHLAFDFTNKSPAGNTVHLDGGASCVIDMVRVLSTQGVELERIEGYNLISTIIKQYTSTEVEMREDAALASGVSNLLQIHEFNVVSGYGYNALMGETLDVNIKRHYELKLKASGWFNPDLKKLLPPGSSFILEITLATGNEALVKAQKNFYFKAAAMATANTIDLPRHGLVTGDRLIFNTNGNTEPTETAGVISDGTIVVVLVAATNTITVENTDGTDITWNTGEADVGDRPFSLNLVPLTTPTVLTYQLEQLKLRIPAIRVEDPAFIDRVAMLKQRGYVWTAPSYKRYINTILNATGVETVQISDRSYSLDGLICVLRESGKVNSAANFGNSVRSINYLSSWQAQFGSQLYPPARIEYLSGSGSAAKHRAFGELAISQTQVDLNISEAYAECKRIFGYGRGVIDGEAFAQSEQNNGAGLMCISTRAYQDDGRLLSGLDTKSSALPITLSMTKVTANADDGTTTFGTSKTGVLHTYAKCAIQFSMQPETGILTSAT